jgi:preprotein translocase subunit Sec63
MPPAPAFDYYETLEIGKSATIEEIKSSYRRLALVHHPDRNPDNIDESTAAFQRVSRTYTNSPFQISFKNHPIILTVNLDPDRPRNPLQ